MRCGIYKITNNINGKVYIGKSKNIEERWTEHKRLSSLDEEDWKKDHRSCQTPIHKAIRKYGVENFSFDVIEETTEDVLNEREIYWIDYYNSYKDRSKGYNLTKGGDGFDFGKGENAVTAKLTQKDVDFIKQKLREHWTAKQIQDCLPIKVGASTISAINNGQNWKVEGEKYPISPNNGHRKFTEEQIKEIRKKYKLKEKNIKELGKEYHVTADTIFRIVNFKSYTDIPEE